MPTKPRPDVEVSEDNQWLIIAQSPELTIPYYCFSMIFGPDAEEAELQDSWVSLITNREGHLKHFSSDEIIIIDGKAVSEETKPAPLLLSFPDPALRAEAERCMDQAGLASLSDYILAAVAFYNQHWAAASHEEAS